MSHEQVRNDLLVGILHTYNVQSRLTAFESGDVESPSTVIFVGGLGDGLAAVPYIAPLSRSLQLMEWSLTQVLLTSSYTGFGRGSIAQDAKELRMCIDHLRKLGKHEFVLLGHSTGCQDIVRFFLNHQKETPQKLGIKGVILQGAISDREYIIDTMGKDKHAMSIQIAQTFLNNERGDEPMPSDFSDFFSGGKCTITASRWLSLALPYSSHSRPADSEDYFSSDLDSATLRLNLGRIGDAGVPAAVVFSGRDEGMPAHVDKNQLKDKFLKAIEGTEKDGLREKMKDLVIHSAEEQREKVSEQFSKVINGAGHVIEEEDATEEFLTLVTQFVKALS